MIENLETTMELNSNTLALTSTQVCQILGITDCTYRAWERKGVAPKGSRIPGYQRSRVLAKDLEEWLAKRQADRERTGRWHIRHMPIPLVPAQSCAIDGRPGGRP